MCFVTEKRGKKEMVDIFYEDLSEKQETNSCAVGTFLMKQKYALWAVPVMYTELFPYRQAIWGGLQTGFYPVA